MDIVLYSAHGSNSSERVEWMLQYKGISYLKVVQQDEMINPYGYVPSLSVNGTILAESMAIAEYLEEVFPENPLLPDKAFDRALVREICEYVNSTIHQPQNRSVLQFLKPELSGVAKHKLRGEWIVSGLNKLKPRLWKRSSFAVGDSFSLADIFVTTIYRKALSHGADRLQEYDSFVNSLVGIAGYDGTTRNET